LSNLCVDAALLQCLFDLYAIDEGPGCSLMLLWIPCLRFQVSQRVQHTSHGAAILYGRQCTLS